VAKLAADLFGPVGMVLARAVPELPGSGGMPGGSQFELKWDGFRAAAVVRAGEVRLWSRNGKDFTSKFPDVAAALTRQVDVDCVLDGELVVWTGERLDFDALQQRNVQGCFRVVLGPDAGPVIGSNSAGGSSPISPRRRGWLN
jgi:ATP-dependent DNA ligase